MSTREVFKRFYPKLIGALPLDDNLFTSILYSHGLLTEDLKERVKAEKTPNDKATCFLDRTISRDISIGHFNSFEELLEIMQESDHGTLKTLAKQIKTSLQPINSVG